MGKNYKYERAIGILYEGTGVPEVSLKGLGVSADEIVRIAKQYGVPVIEQSEAARALQQFELDEEIPEFLFEVIATILCELEAT